MTATVAFRNVLREGSKGTQPVAVKRGLYRAGVRHGWAGLDSQPIAAEVLGPIAAANLRAYQADEGLPADGVYGPVTHQKLVPWFDDYAALLYTQTPPVGPPLQLPMRFTATHQTAGLPGFPAIDLFAKPGTRVLAPQAGVIVKLSGHDPEQGGTPGGAYGWSLYIAAAGCVFFVTHLRDRFVELGDEVKRGTPVGTVCDAAVAGMASSSSHVHLGRHEGTWET